ncbi:hypothetical protein NMG60_11008179 [Bertholletia excelsa]
MAPQEQILYSLYCEEEHFEGELPRHDLDEGNVKESLVFGEHGLDWENDELVSLLSKEKESHLGLRGLISDGSLMAARREVVDWMLRVISYYDFSALTALLAVNYFDRFMSSVRFQRDKPWMCQLSAVTCLSLASKVEETQVPLLLDLQVGETKYVFEAKTIQRMELLVLSTLKWKMNPVTPLSFIDHIVRRLGLKIQFGLEFLRRCERLLLLAITDSGFACYLPSVLAAVTMSHVIEEVEPCNSLDCQNELMGILKISREKVDDCHKLFVKLASDHGLIKYQSSQTQKRKYQSIPSSPTGVFDTYFSSDSSNDSWAVTLSGPSSPEPLLKKSRALHQEMRG